MKKNKKGFTLIELLVVVLIIGILAAIALPQYNKAVEKSRLAEVWTTLHATEQAAQEYYLDHGEYPGNLSTLDDAFRDHNGIAYRTRTPLEVENHWYTCSTDNNLPLTYAVYHPRSGGEFVLMMCNGKRFCENNTGAVGKSCSDLGFNTVASGLRCTSANAGNCYTE